MQMLWQMHSNKSFLSRADVKGTAEASSITFICAHESIIFKPVLSSQVGTQIYRAAAHDPDDQPVLRYAIDKTGSVARDEDGIPISMAEYDYLSLWDLNAVDGTLKVVR